MGKIGSLAVLGYLFVNENLLVEVRLFFKRLLKGLDNFALLDDACLSGLHFFSEESPFNLEFLFNLKAGAH